MEFPDQTKAAMNQAMQMAREGGFLVVAAAYNENDGSIQFINNDGMSRSGCAKVLETALEVLHDHGARCSKTEPPNLVIGEA